MRRPCGALELGALIGAELEDPVAAAGLLRAVPDARTSRGPRRAQWASGAPAGWLTGSQFFFAGFHSVTTALLTSRPRCGTRA